MTNESYPGKNRTKRRFRYKEDRDALGRALDKMIELLQQAVWLLAIIAIVLLAIFLGSVALIMMS